MSSTHISQVHFLRTLAILLAASSELSMYLARLHILSQYLPVNKLNHHLHVARRTISGIASNAALPITDIRKEACEYGSVSYALR